MLYLCIGFFKVIIRWFLCPDNDVNHASGFFVLFSRFFGVANDDDDNGRENHSDADEEARGEMFVEHDGADSHSSDRLERTHNGSRRRADEAYSDGHSDERDERRHDAQHKREAELSGGGDGLQCATTRVYE